MHELDQEHGKIYHMTPQYRKNPKSHQIQRLTQRISLLKHQLQKQKHQTHSDQAHLKQMNAISETFQNKIFSELVKCHQLKQFELKTHKTHVQNNLRTQNQISTLQPSFELNNQNRLNSKANFNAQFSTGQGFLPIECNQIPKKEKREKEQKHETQRPIKKVSSSSPKNTIPKQKNKHKYLKETFLTSIIFILFTLVLHQIIQLF